MKMFLDIEKLTLSILSFQNFFFNSLQSLLPYSELLDAEYLEPGEKQKKSTEEKLCLMIKKGRERE